MSVAIALAVRAIIQTLIIFGITALAERYVLPLVNRAIAEIMETLGVPEDTAQDIMANEVLLFAEKVGVATLAVRSKLPASIADRLGFSSKGYAPRKIPQIEKVAPAISAGIKKGVAIGGIQLGTGILTLTGGLLTWNLLTDWVWIGNTLGFLPEDAQNDIQKRALSIKNLIDAPKSLVYGAQKQRRQISQQERELIRASADAGAEQISELKKVYEQKFMLFGRADVVAEMRRATIALTLELEVLRQMAGLIPRKPIETEKIEGIVGAVFDGDTIQLSSGETVRMVGIDAPESTTAAGEKSKKWLKEKIENKKVRVESDPGALMDMYGRRLGVIYLDEKNINIEMLREHLAEFSEFEPNALVFKKQWKAAAAERIGDTRSVRAVRVFTGIVSQGKLGDAAAFTPREDDLIDSLDDLRAGAENNLAQFLISLPARIVYEIKIVAQITDANGFKRRGEARRIVTGYGKNGEPRHKTIINKFAICDVYVFTARNVRTKIQTIVLGPTDAVAFQPQAEDIQNLETALRANLATQKTEDIATIRGVDVSAAAAPATSTWDDRLPTWQEYSTIPAAQEFFNRIGGDGSGSAGVKVTENWYHINAQNDYAIWQRGRERERERTEAVTAPGAPQGVAVAAPFRGVCAASNLSAFYSTQNKKLPSVAERGALYESYGLGQGAWYTGTAEQNLKLLAALKSRSGCTL